MTDLCGGRGWCVWTKPSTAGGVFGQSHQQQITVQSTSNTSRIPMVPPASPRHPQPFDKVHQTLSCKTYLAPIMLRIHPPFLPSQSPASLLAILASHGYAYATWLCLHHMAVHASHGYARTTRLCSHHMYRETGRDQPTTYPHGLPHVYMHHRPYVHVLLILHMVRLVLCPTYPPAFGT
jgi:hypothetical protein